MSKSEISVEEFIRRLNTFNDEKNYNLRFLSPTKTQLQLDCIYKEHPDTYVLVEFVVKNNNDSINLNEFICKFKELGENYSKTFIDFLRPKYRSMIIDSDSIKKGKNNNLIVQFKNWEPEIDKAKDSKNDEIARSLITSIFGN